MKTIIRNAIVILFISFPLFAHAESVESTISPFSVRIRPMALVFGIFGAEVYYETQNGYYVGLTANFFEADNEDKDTSLSTNELGIKFGKFFGDTYNSSGFWVQGAVNFNYTVVSNFYEPTQQNLSANFEEFSEVVSVGYQFRMTFVDPEHLNIRLGAGVEYKPASDTIHDVAADGRSIPISVRKRLDPSIELTIGYLI